MCFIYPLFKLGMPITFGFFSSSITVYRYDEMGMYDVPANINVFMRLLSSECWEAMYYVI